MNTILCKIYIQCELIHYRMEIKSMQIKFAYGFLASLQSASMRLTLIKFSFIVEGTYKACKIKIA